MESATTAPVYTVAQLPFEPGQLKEAFAAGVQMLSQEGTRQVQFPIVLNATRNGPVRGLDQQRLCGGNRQIHIISDCKTGLAINTSQAICSTLPASCMLYRAGDAPGEVGFFLASARAAGPRAIRGSYRIQQAAKVIC